ncbi:MAG TPA: winged helix-turn-helix domain-containing protein [Burkholderiales bacterium]|nr:winged helix-turn-helix domain-containing protein [Burkholderiales bacterium]
MDDEPNIPRIANLLADPARARILRALIDGTMRPAGELAYTANISAQSASAHLGKLVDGGLLTSEAQGRHRYFRIASAQVADAIESLASLSVAILPRAPRGPLPSKSVSIQFLRARTCYDHLAGEAAVQICEGMLKARWLIAERRDYCVTRLGEKKLAALDVDLAAARGTRRVLARACVDLTQRRPHLGGALGAALLDLYVARGWILRTRRSRAVTITPRGNEAFGKLFCSQQ